MLSEMFVADEYVAACDPKSFFLDCEYVTNGNLDEDDSSHPGQVIGGIITEETFACDTTIESSTEENLLNMVTYNAQKGRYEWSVRGIGGTYTHYASNIQTNKS